VGPAGILHHKTRILVTHGIGFLPQTDAIVVLANGTVSETGSYRQLLQNAGVFAEFLRTYLTEEAHTLAEEDPEAVAITNEILGEMGVKRQTSVSSGTSTLSRIRKVLRATSMISGISAAGKNSDHNGGPMERKPNVFRPGHIEAIFF
jgi:ABC-type glutathione transport system ATPase component